MVNLKRKNQITVIPVSAKGGSASGGKTGIHTIALINKYLWIPRLLGRRIYKRGRVLIRKLLFYTVINVIRKGCILHDYYQRLITRGMNRMKSIITVRLELIRDSLITSIEQGTL